MNLTNYGITDAKSLLENVVFIRLRTGENLVSYSYRHENGIVAFLPLELVKQDDDSYSFRSFIPFVQERIFFLHMEDISIVKAKLLQVIHDRYISFTESMYKNDIEELLFSTDSIRTVEAEIELASGAVVH